MALKYHIDLDEEKVQGAEYALLPGDPARVEKTAKYLDPDARFLAAKREYTSFLSDLEGRKVLVLSTGIGGPGVSLALEELADLGLKYFYRIGTTGAIQPHIGVPALIITLGAVRLDGVSTHYAPIEYPAVADLEMTNSLVQAARELQMEHHVGVTASADSFYPGQERYDTYSKYVIRRFQGTLKEWQQLNVLNYEMESASLFTIVRAFGLHAACVASTIVNRTVTEQVSHDLINKAERNLAIVIKRALELHMRERT